MEVWIQKARRMLELRQADRASFRERERSLRRQIANVSHDLRTPLTSILGYLQLLEDEALPAAERREYLAVVASRAKALQSLITSFYDLSRLEGGEYPLSGGKRWTCIPASPDCWRPFTTTLPMRASM